MDGSAESVEARDRLSSMGCAGALRIRRSALHFLSSSFLDVRSRLGSVPAMEGGTCRVCLAGAHSFWLLDVCTRASVAKSAGRNLHRSSLRRQSLLSRDRVLA